MSRRDLVLLLALPLSLGACADLRSVGPCDTAAAREVVYVESSEDDFLGVGGLPVFAGQALMIRSCGFGAHCHSPAAMTDGSRDGAPVGLDFDVRVACDQRPPTLGVCTESHVRPLVVQRDRTYAWRNRIWDSVTTGSMPPGGRGRARLDQTNNDSYVRADGSALPELSTEEGRELFRNWLACDAPVVERAEVTAAGVRPGDWCGDGVTGDCRYGVPRTVVPAEPNWDSIFERLIFPQCGSSCHSPGTDEVAESALDLSTIDVAYEQMVGRVAEGAFCLDEGLQHVAPNAPDDSLLVQKLEGMQSCGESMPLGIPALPPDVVAPVREWIAAGAPRE